MSSNASATASLPASQSVPSNLTRVDHRTRTCVRLVQWLTVPVGRRDHDGNVDAALRSEGEVALVVRGDAHHRARAVAEQHIVGDPDLDVVAGEGMLGVGAGEDAGFLALGGLALDLVLPAGLL